MKKSFFLCVLIFSLLVTSTPLFGSYQASGKIYTSSGGAKSPANGAIGTLSTNSGSSTTPMTTSNSNNDWYAGWSSGDLSGKKMRGSAQLNSFMGSKSWDASSTGVDKGKDITLYSTVAYNPGLGIDMEAVAFAGPGLQSGGNVSLINNLADFPAVGFTAEIVFNPDQIQLNGADFPPDSFFDVFFDPLPTEPNKAIVNGTVPQGQGSVLIPNGVVPLFEGIWEVLPFTMRDSTNVTINVTLIPEAPIGENAAIPHEVEITLGSMEQQDPYLALNSEIDWQEILDINIRPMLPENFEGYIMQWQEPEYLQFPDLPYPPDPYLPPTIYVYPGDEANPDDPNEPGLVMKWGEEDTPDGNYTAAWEYVYSHDPDYTNCIIQVTVIAPQFGLTPPHNQINIVSFGLQNIPAANGPVRSWYWNCGPGTNIPWNTPVTITIDTSKTGVTAASPVATNYLNNPGFNLTTVQYLIFDENANLAANPVAPPPGQQVQRAWNYWQNLTVTPKAGGNSVDSKWHVKYSQPPVLWDENADNLPPLIRGWDQLSTFEDVNVMADDWKCEDDRPVTDVHWWGSFIGWNKPYLPQGSIPSGFHIGIWTDVPAGTDPNPDIQYSHPGMLIWENYCDSYIWNYAGIDRDPRDEPMADEACFQFAQFLSEDEWFHQHPMEDGQPNVYWLSIAPLYPDGVTPEYKWGWKTREKFFNDDACSITSVQTGNWPFKIFDVWASGTNLLATIDGVTEGWDLAFELTTNEPGPISADLNDDNIVDLVDLAILADQWLTSGP